MKILLIGASGTIGKRIYETMSAKHEIVKASRTGGDVSVDITSASSIEDMYKGVENIDAVICAAGPVAFAPFDKITSFTPGTCSSRNSHKSCTIFSNCGCRVGSPLLEITMASELIDC